jgi:argininosuccinate lyase
VAKCIELNTTLEDLPLAEYKAVCDLFDDGVYTAINLDKCVSDRTVYGGPAPSEVKKQVAEFKARLEEI